MLKVSSVPLLRALRKPNIPVRLAIYHGSSDEDTREKVLSPVLFHGTELIRPNQWQNQGFIGGKFLSLGEYYLAASYASYFIYKVWGEVIVLQNNSNRRIFLKRSWPGISNDEVSRISGQRITQSLLIFDTGKILDFAARHKRTLYCMEDEQVNGLQIKWRDRHPRKRRKIDFNAVIAGLNVNEKERIAYWQIYSEQLWEDNFNIQPPELGRLKCTHPVEGCVIENENPGSIMAALAGSLFGGGYNSKVRVEFAQE